ncbi:MAG: DNA-processing protein DprA [Candidatus Omnitrophota bacterium]
MNRFEAFVSLNLVREIGSTRLKKLLEIFGKPENILKACVSHLAAASGIGEKSAYKIRSLKKEDLERELSLARKLNLKIITLEDKDYPENLKHIPDPPIVLYVKGELQKEDRLAIGIVGSRRATFYGLTQAERFALELSERCFTIVSGLARGVDTYAHKGALKAKGRTIAVMGSGFNRIYPEENIGLAEDIFQAGAVVSEFPIDMPPLKENFPCRNRIISGLSLGVLVVEAAKTSGALITADFALEQGREVFAIPGKVDSHNSFGTLGLIKEGAKLVSSVDDILEELNMGMGFHQEAARHVPHPRNSTLKETESLVYGLISHETVLLDDIVEKTNMDISKISDILLRLQIKKLIQQLPGKQFVRIEAT